MKEGNKKTKSNKKASKEQVIKAIQEGLNAFECMARFKCGSTTISNYLVKYSLSTPAKFYTHRDSIIGRPKGIPMSEDQKKLRSKLFQGKGNPFYGIKHTKKTRRKMSKNHANFKGKNNPFKKWIESSEENREKFRNKVKMRWANYSEAKRREISSNFSKARAENFKSKNKNLHKNHKSGFYNSSKFKSRFFYRSSWELQFIKFCEGSDFIVDLKCEPFVVPYRDSTELKRYTRIDFFFNFRRHYKIYNRGQTYSIVEVL